MQEVRSSILLISTIRNVITTQFANCVVIFICTMKGDRELWSKYGRNIIGLTVRGGRLVRIDTNIGIVIVPVGSRRRQFFTSNRREVKEVVSGKSFFTMTKNAYDIYSRHSIEVR